MDPLGLIFATVTLVVFLCAGVYSLEYMKDGRNLKSYSVFYMLAMLTELMMCAAANLVTFYMCFELLTVTAVPLVVHDRTKESKSAALKYLFFSMFGAYMALFGIYNLSVYADTLSFRIGGSISADVWDVNKGILLVSAFMLITGFSVKAGMWPMHAWLTAAHPVAPAPASAVLSACIVNAGVLGILRGLWYVTGTEHLGGTWVQTVFMILTLITIFMGSMLAYREPLMKKRLAYSTVSQMSYILFGLAVSLGTGEPSSITGASDALTGSILHVMAHAAIKGTLFLVAGAAIHYMGAEREEDMRGLGSRMPVTMICYTIASLGLIGIPPTGGFISKWYLATGALAMDIPVFSVLGPAVLLVSALLTAGYLLKPAVLAFFPGAEYRETHGDIARTEPGPLMTIPIATLTLISLLLGIYPEPVLALIRQIFIG